MSKEPTCPLPRSPAQELPPTVTRSAQHSRTTPPGTSREASTAATRFIGPPYAFASAEGAYVRDLDGNRYLDYHAAFGAVLLGHNSPIVRAALMDSLDGPDLVGLGVSRPEVELARRIIEVIPSAESVILTMSGSEATAQAVRLARAATGRSLLIKFQGGVPRRHDAVARNVISAPDKAYGRDPLSAGLLDAAIDATLIAEFNDSTSVRELFAAHPDDIAAVILEPIPHNVGALLPTQEFVEDLRAVTDEFGAVLIFDEVITGFRHALGGYQEVCGVTPDLHDVRQGHGERHPGRRPRRRRDLIAAVQSRRRGRAARRHVQRQSAVMCGGDRHDRLPAVAPELYVRTHELGGRIRAGLTTIADELGIEATVAGFGGVFAMYFASAPISGYRDLLRNDNSAYVSFHRRMTERGFLMLPLALGGTDFGRTHRRGHRQHARRGTRCADRDGGATAARCRAPGDPHGTHLE